MYNVTCSCNRLKLSFSKEPFAQLVCHCKDCQQVSRRHYTEVVFFRPEADFLEGESNATSMTGGSGLNKSYQQCASCGEFVYATVDALKGMVGVVAEKIQAPFQFTPMAHVWTSQKQSDVEIPTTAMQFEQAPVFPGR